MPLGLSSPLIGMPELIYLSSNSSTPILERTARFVSRRCRTFENGLGVQKSQGFSWQWGCEEIDSVDAQVASALLTFLFADLPLVQGPCACHTLRAVQNSTYQPTNPPPINKAKYTESRTRLIVQEGNPHRLTTSSRKYNVTHKVKDRRTN